MTLDSIGAFTVTVTPQSVLWKFFYTVLFVNILDHDQVRRLSGLVCVQAVNGNDMWWQPKLLSPIKWVAARDMYGQKVWNCIRRNFVSGLIRF